MKIVEANNEQLNSLIELRYKVWGGNKAVLKEEAKLILERRNEKCFFLLDEENAAVGFIEGTLYNSVDQKYGYVEGWYVIPQFQNKGHGTRLMDQLEQWFLHNSIKLSLSDTDPNNYPISEVAHYKNGYKHFMDIKIFIKKHD